MKIIARVLLISIIIGCKSKTKIPDTDSNSLDSVITNYINLKDGFIQLDTAQISKALHLLTQPFEFPTNIKIGSKENVLTAMEEIQEICKQIKEQNSIEAQLNIFKDLTMPMQLFLKNYNKTPFYVQHCPMAEKYSEDSSVYWISREEKVLNPFFPKQMLQCGEVTDTIPKVKFLESK